jgi:tetratricopeptide (TPR) repeat protein
MKVVPREQPLDKARALAQEALTSWRGADPGLAIDACDHALALLLPVGPSDALADVLRWKGSILRDRGQYGEACDLYSQSLTVADAIGYRSGRAHALNCLGSVAMYRGDLTAAERWYGESARLAHRLADRRLGGLVQMNLGIVAAMQQRSDEAVAHFRLALAAFELEDYSEAVIWVLNNLGLLYIQETAFLRAEEVLDRALTVATKQGDMASEGIVQENRALLFVATGRLDDANRSAVRAYEIAERRRDNTRRAAAMRLLARIERARDPDTRHAVILLERALTLCEMGEDAQLRAELLMELGDATRAAGELSRAKELWRRALELARIAGFSGMIGQLQTRLRPPTTERGPAIETTTV